MCLICVDFLKEQMTLKEARRALGEMVVTMEPGHEREVREMLEKAEKEAEQKAKQGQSNTP